MLMISLGKTCTIETTDGQINPNFGCVVVASIIESLQS